MDIRWEQRLARGDWSVRTEIAARMTGGADAWRMTAEVTAWEGEGIVFARLLDETVPRLFG